MKVDYIEKKTITSKKSAEIEDIENCFLKHRENSCGYTEYFGQFRLNENSKTVYTIVITLGCKQNIKIDKIDIKNAPLELNIRSFIESSGNYKYEIISKESFMKIFEDIVIF